MKSVLISIRPEWVWKITRDEKTIEVRKTAPKEVPFKAYIYMTKKKPCMLTFAGNGKMRVHNGMVIGEFICDKVDEYTFSHYEAEYRVTHVQQEAMFLNQPELIQYGKGKTLYGWHITDLKIYDKPKELSEFNRPCPSVNHNCEHCITYGKPYQWDFDEEAGKIFCTRRITRPPQSWCYVEEKQ